MRLYLLQLGILPELGNTPIPGYLIQADDGKNVLIDTGYPRRLRGRQAEVADEMVAAAPDDSEAAFTAALLRGIRDDPADMVANRLAEIGLAPGDIDYLVCTHFDWDHAGDHDLFPDADLVVQRGHYEVAQEHPRFRMFDATWDSPALRYRFVDGDTTLLPDIELIEAGGHVPALQAVLVRLPETGPVLLATDAIAGAGQLNPAAAAGPADMDPVAKRASVRKLLDVADREGAKLIVFGHSGEQWATLKHSPEYYS
jgi:N-acyl homoserine lactone hydrolase